MEEDRPGKPFKLLTVREVAQYLGVSEPTIWRWLRQGYLKGLKVGKARRIPLDEVRGFIDSGAVGVVKETQPEYGVTTRSGSSLQARLFVSKRLKERLKKMREERAAQGEPSPSVSSADVLEEVRLERSWERKGDRYPNG